MTLVLCGLAGFFVAQIVKSVLLPTTIKRPWKKMVLALIGSGGVAALVFAHHYSELAVYTVAGAGLAAVIHRIWRLLTYVGDWCVRQIQESRGGR